MNDRSKHRTDAGPPPTSAVLSRGSTLVVTALIGLGLAARFYGLGRQSLWIDELTSLQFADPAGAESLLDLLTTDLNPPLYTVLLHFWHKAVTVSDATARLPSAVLGFMAIACAFLQGRRLLQKDALFLYTGFLACSYGAIYYAQEVRSYSLLLFLSTLVTLSALNAAQAISQKQPIPVGQLALVAGGGLAAAYTHYFGVLIFGAATTVLFLACLRHRRNPLSVVATGVAVLLLFLPWVFFHTSQLATRYTEGDIWAAMSVGSLVQSLGWFAQLLTGNALSALLLAGLGGFALWRCRSTILRDELFLAATLIAVLATVYAILISVFQPIISGRNLIILFPACYLVLAHLLAKGLPERTFAITAPIMLAALLFGSLYDYYRPHKQQWRESAAFVASQENCRTGNIVMLGGHRIMRPEETHYRHYLPDNNAISLRSISSFVDNASLRAWTGQGPCPVLLWAVHLRRHQFDKILNDIGWADDAIELQEFLGAYLVMRSATASPQ